MMHMAASGSDSSELSQLLELLLTPGGGGTPWDAYISLARFVL